MSKNCSSITLLSSINSILTDSSVIFSSLKVSVLIFSSTTILSVTISAYVPCVPHAVIPNIQLQTIAITNFFFIYSSTYNTFSNITSVRFQNKKIIPLYTYAYVNITPVRFISQVKFFSTVYHQFIIENIINQWMYL